MPRIPSAADISPVGAGASRLSAVRADARDFGSAIGQGLEDFGEGLVAARPLVEELLRKEEQQATAEESAEVSSHVVAARDGKDQAAAGWNYDGSPPRAEAARANREFARMEEGLLKSHPPERRARARAATAAMRPGFVLEIAQTAHNRRVEALGRKTDETLQKLQEQAVRAPAAAEHRADEGTALLRDQLAAGALTAEQFAARNEDFRRKLFAAVVQSQPAADAVADLEAGLYDAVLGDPALRDHLLTQARWRLQSEAVQGQAAAQAVVEAERRGAGQPALRERTKRLLAASDMADAELAAERARRARESLEAVRYAPEAAVQEAIAGLTPGNDAADAGQRGKLQEEVRAQAEAMLRERRDDPAAYVMDQPAVAEAFAAAARDPALLGDAVAARLAAQAAMGLPLDQRRALTRNESAEILGSLDALPPAGRVAALAELGRRYEEQSGAVVAALTEAGLSPVEALLVDAADDPGVRRALTRIAAREGQGGEGRTAEGNLIAGAAERLLAESRGSASPVATRGAESTPSRSLPPLPARRPERLPPHGVEGPDSYDDLPREDYGVLADRLDPAEVAALEAHVERAGRAAGAGASAEELARRLAVRNLRAGFPFGDAVDQALNEAGIAAAGGPGSRPNNQPMEPAEREARELLSLMTPDFPSAIQDPERALTFVRDVMAFRQTPEANRSAAYKALHEKLATLEGTEDRFLYPILRDALKRAHNRPETVPWALTDAELRSVYDAMGKSGELLSNVGSVTEPLPLVPQMADAGALQQSWMRRSYERELKRRGYLKLPGD